MKKSLILFVFILFVFTIRLTANMILVYNTNLSAGTTITLPLYGTVHQVLVDWNGEGDFEWLNSPGDKNHTYSSEGTYTVTIYEGGGMILTQFGFGNRDNPPNADKLIKITDFGNLGISSLSGAFNGAHNLTEVPANLPASITDLSYLFYSNNITSVTNLNNWDTQHVTNMKYMFYDTDNFNQDISSWNLSSVTNMEYMFSYATNFNLNIGNWNVSNVENMSHLFYYAVIFNQNIDNWVVSNVTDMQYMFSNTPFNQNISVWNVTNVTNMSHMFDNAYNFNQDIGTWNVSNVTSMSHMFERAGAFNQNIGYWDVSGITDMTYMFYNASAFNQDISDWDISSISSMMYFFYGASSFNQDIGGWDVAHIKDMRYMFYNASAFNQDIGDWSVDSVVSMDNMFYNATSFDQDIGSWNVGSVLDMGSMFSGVTLSTINYNSILTGWDTLSLQYGVNFDGGNSKYSPEAAAVAKAHMISSDGWVITDGGVNPDFILEFNTNLSSGTSISLPLYGVVNVSVDWGDGFSDSYNTNGDKSHTYSSEGVYVVSISGTLTEFGRGSTPYPNANKLSKLISFGNVWLTSLSGAFNGAGNLLSVPVSLPSNLVGLSYTFYNNTSSGFSNIRNWNVGNVTNMDGMFAGASVFNEDISGWDVGSVTTMQNMFAGATAFDRDLGSWNVGSVTAMNSMFSGVTLSTLNYNNILKGWNLLSLQSNVSFDAGSSKYSPGASAAARAGIISNHGWTIYDGGEETSITWNGSLSADWNGSGNWDGGTVPKETDNVVLPFVATTPVIAPTDTASCNNLIIDAGGLLTIQSTASSTGSLITYGNVSGHAEMQRYIAAWSSAADGWHLISSPVAAQAISDFHTAGSSSNDFYKWDEVNDIWVNRTASNGTLNTSFETNFEVGKGYMIAYGTASAGTKSFTGVFNITDVSISGLTNTTGNTSAGWHLLGNPYPSALYWNKTAWSLSDIDATAKVWDESSASYSDVAAGGILPAMQGFMVHVTTSGSSSGSLTIDASDRTHSSTSWYKNSTNEENTLKLTVSEEQNNTAQESIIRVNEDATTGFDPQFDSHFLAGFAPQFYSVLEDGSAVSTNVLPDVSTSTTIPFAFIKNSATDYTNRGRS